MMANYNISERQGSKNNSSYVVKSTSAHGASLTYLPSAASSHLISSPACAGGAQNASVCDGILEFTVTQPTIYGMTWPLNGTVTIRARSRRHHASDHHAAALPGRVGRSQGKKCTEGAALQFFLLSLPKPSCQSPRIGLKRV